LLIRTAALVALDPKHYELADEVAENDGAFTGHDCASRFSRDTGAAAMSSTV
jgi:hypothetical protein